VNIARQPGHSDSIVSTFSSRQTGVFNIPSTQCGRLRKPLCLLFIRFNLIGNMEYKGKTVKIADNKVIERVSYHYHLTTLQLSCFAVSVLKTATALNWKSTSHWATEWATLRLLDTCLPGEDACRGSIEMLGLEVEDEVAPGEEAWLMSIEMQGLEVLDGQRSNRCYVCSDESVVGINH